MNYMARDNLVNGGRTCLNQVITLLTQQGQAVQG